jgi:hypothetical protein
MVERKGEIPFFLIWRYANIFKKKGKGDMLTAL